MRHHRKAAGAAAAALALIAVPATASAHDGHHGYGGGEPITTVAGGLDGPRQLSDDEHHGLLVAESDSGEVSAVDVHTGEVRTLLSGLGAAQGVDSKRGWIYVAVGEAGPPPEDGAAPAAPPPGTPTQVLLEATADGQIHRSIDLLQYELDHNPDGQVQFVDGQPVDALSNPFSVLAQRHRVLVSDAGANAVLSVDRHTGEISTFFVPPTVTDVEGCAEAPNNPGTVGCDSVPTEITEGPDGLIYLGTLGAEVPGAGRVYVLDQHGNQVDVITGLTSVTGVAVGDHCEVYVSNVVEGAPEGEEPPPGFDPATVGEVTRIGLDGSRTTAQVTMPTGLEIRHGELYASAWSIAGFVGLQGRGEVQRVGAGAFQAPAP